MVSRHVFFGVNGVYRALGNAHGAIDALIWVDDQKVWAFTEAIDWANVYTVGVFAFDARLGHYVCHDSVGRLS
ncbi:hypothetical protein GCM10007875_17760 [Limnobacter litoralis]|uniref:Uncharacterized protein n=1 Tax=Limnobacter litoralis TaxID=481366 RepID=A0ABQ5YS19_9BURK|nr:hypothetical protein GCM10007875_17760 [Limnobacter litoralis]